MPNYSNIGFIFLKLITLLIILIGYFMNTQQLNKAQQDNGNPIFKNKNDFFYYEFKKVILIVDEQFTGFDSDVCYHIDSQFSINYDVLFNSVIHGISPIAQLQYWNIQYKTLDSIPYQLSKHGKTSYLSSYKPYSDYDQYSQYITLNDGKQLVAKIREDDFSFLYVDNLQLSSMEYDDLLAIVDNSTMLIVLKFDKVYFKTKRERLSTEKHSSTVYSIDSLTSTISCLLDIPIPLENHGIILPRLIYPTNTTNDTNLIQINDYMMNLYQLYEHYSLIEKKKSIQYQKDLDQFADQFQLVMENSQNTQVEAFLSTIISEIKQLAIVINSEISGNVFVLFLGLFLSVYTLYLIFFKQQELMTIDWYVIGLTLGFALIEINLIKIILFVLLLIRMRQSIILSTLGLLLLITQFPLYQIIWIGSIIYLYYKNQILIKEVLINTEKESLGKFITIIFLSIISQYNVYCYVLLIPFIIYTFKGRVDLIIAVTCLTCRIQNALPILLLSMQFYKENEGSYFHYPAYLIIDVLFITITNPVFPSSPILMQFDGYLRILDIVGLVFIQQMFYQFQTALNQSLELNGETVISHLKKIGNNSVEYFDAIILQSIIEIVWIGEMIITEIFSTDMKRIGSQYFTLQFICLNVIILFLYLVRQAFIEGIQENAQISDQYEVAGIEKNDVEMREIEI